jgi:hypothetical protein
MEEEKKERETSTNPQLGIEYTPFHLEWRKFIK